MESSTRYEPTLLKLITKMRAGTPVGQALPTPEVADQALSIAILGDRNRIKKLNVTRSGSGR